MTGIPDAGDSPALSAPETDLRISEEHYRALFEESDDALYVLDLAGKLTDVNRAAETMLGYTRAELLNLSIGDLVPEDQQPRMREMLDRKVGGATSTTYDLELFRKDSSRIVVEISSHVIARDGEPIAVYGRARDVTQSRAVERALRRSEERYRSLVAATSDIIWSSDADGRIIEPQPSWEAYTGQRWPVYAGEGWLDMVHPGDREAVRASWHAALVDGGSFESQGRLWHEASGAYHHYSGRAVALHNEDGSIREWMGTVRDIHERRLAAERSRARERELRTVLENLPVGVWLTDTNGAILLDNSAGERIWGIRHDGRAHVGAARGWWVDSGAPLRLDDWSLTRALRGETVLNELIEIETADGTRKTILSSAVPVRDDDATLQGAVVINEDVTDRMRAEAAFQVLAEAGAVLGESLEFEATLAGVARVAVPRLADWCAIDIIGEDGAINRLVVAAQDPATEVQVRELRSRFPYDQPEPSRIALAIRAGESQLVTEVTDELLVGSARDEEHLRQLRALKMTSFLRVPLAAHGHVLGALSLVSAASGRHYGAEDLTLALELARRAAIAVENARLYRAAQESARTAEAAVAVRDQFLQIAAHELRTPLTPLKASVQILRRQLARGATAAELEGLAGRTERQVDRLASLIAPLLDVSRISTGRLAIEQAPVALVPLVERVVEMERAAEDPPRPIAVSCPDEKAVVIGDEGRLEQVLVNLLENARKYSLPGSSIELAVDCADGTVTISVRDHGIGIPEAEHGQVFERFHRASNAGRNSSGFGLGLSIAREIVQMHGGTLSVASTPGEGSTFTISLPLAATE